MLYEVLFVLGAASAVVCGSVVLVIQLLLLLLSTIAIVKDD